VSALTGKRGVVALALAGALVLVASASRTWVSGTVDDAVLGASRVSGTGSQLAPGLVAIALAGAAAALAATTSGRLVRRLTIVVLGLAALGAGGLVVAVLGDPAGRLGDVAARSTGRTGSVETHASTGPWPWLALAGAVLLLAAAVAAWIGAGRWRGLSARYETPAGAPGVSVGGRAAPDSSAQTGAGARGERVASAWESLDAGVDPTEPAPEPPTSAGADPAEPTPPIEREGPDR
jgi:uncharacterized membrane protein (TIGR02234 family)